MTYTITVRVGNHPRGPEFVDYMVAEIANAIARCEIAGVPVNYETGEAELIDSLTTDHPGSQDDDTLEDFDIIFEEGDR